MWTFVLLALGLLGIPAVATAQALFHDTFEGKDGTRPSNYTIVGATGPEFWSIRDGRFHTGNGDKFSGHSFAIIDAPGAAAWKDYRVSVNFVALQTKGRVSIAARYQDPKNYYYASLLSFAPVRKVEIWKLVDGSEKEILTSDTGESGPIPAYETTNGSDKPHTMEFEVRGEELSVYLDGVKLISAQDDQFKTGRAGIGQWYDEVYFDELTVSGTTAGASAPKATAPQGAAPPQGDFYSLLIMDGLTAEEAQSRKDELKENPDVFSMPKGTGYAVYVGRYATQDQASSERERLGNQMGVIIAGVEFIKEADYNQGTSSSPGPGPSAPSKTGSEIRIIAGEVNSEQEAEGLKKQLQDLGFYIVDVVAAGAGFQVLAGPPFASLDDATGSVSELRTNGFPNARVSTAVAIAAAPPTNNDIDQQIQALVDKGATLSDADRAQLRKILSSVGQSRGTGATASDVANIKQEVDSSSQDVKQALIDILGQGESVRIEQRRNALSKDLDAAMQAKDYPKALSVLQEWKTLEPNNSLVDSKIREVTQLRSGGEADATETAASLSLQVNAARGFEDEKKYEDALKAWQDIKIRAISGPLYDEATKKIQQLTPLAEAQHRAQEEANRKAKLMNYGIIGAVGVAALGLIVFLVVMMKRSRTRDEELLRQVQQLTTRSTGSGAHSSRSSKSQPPPPPKPSPGDQERIRPGVSSPAPGAATPPAGPTIAEVASGAVPSRKRQSTPDLPHPKPDLDLEPIAGIDGGLFAPGTPGSDPLVARMQTPKPSEDQVAGGDEGLKLDFLFGGASAPPVPTPIPSTPLARQTPSPDALLRPPSEGPGGLVSAEFKLPPDPDLVAPLNPTPAIEVIQPQVIAAQRQESTEKLVVAAPAKGPSHDVYYSQNFDDEEIGKPPRNWNGSYDYASLLVAPSGNPGSRAMRFEKSTGNGSAYYACRFPDAGGRVIVEFDLKCEDKNKYLLGFYIEKDEDFRQSIHTIVHRTNSSAPPTLRIQGEPTKYELGQWVRLRYEIDLPRHMIDGFVDGVAVATGVRLTAAPKVINTLSIRDNLATTGILLIDNIRITKA